MTLLSSTSNFESHFEILATNRGDVGTNNCNLQMFMNYKQTTGIIVIQSLFTSLTPYRVSLRLVHIFKPYVPHVK